MKTGPKINLTIEGGKELSGTIETNTSKNGVVVLLCASLLNKGTTTLKKVPKIEEVNRLLEVLESIGVNIEKDGSTLRISPPKELNLASMNKEAACMTRSIITFIGPLLHRSNNFHIPQSGGCSLGDRIVRPHFFALEPLGVKVETTKDSFHISHNGLHSSEIILYESGDTVTENALMAAALTSGTTTIKYATANYMVQELCVFLRACGVQIEGIGTTTLTVHGTSEIHEDIEYTLAEDPIDAMFFISAAILTKSTVTITRAPIDFLELELLKLEKMGFEYELSEPYPAHNEHTKLVDITTHPSTLTALQEKIHPLPYPGINVDNLPFFVLMATQAKGETLIHDWMYNGRAVHYAELNDLGANIFLADPHRVTVTGPTPFKAARMSCPQALRPAALLLLAMLAAEGASELRDIYMIKRGYADVAERLNSLGATITTSEK